MRSIDLTGQVFGELTATEPETINKKRGWHCKCSCGKSTWVPTFQLRSGNNKTCGDGLHKQSIKVGDRFGKLTVKRIYRDAKNRRYMAECLCDCGKIKPNASFKNLQRGSTHNCGCVPKARKNKQPVEVSLRNSLISAYRGNAKANGREFDLTVEECEKLFKGDCYLCGKPPSGEHSKKGLYNGGVYLYSSIDRIDSSKGYISGNVKSCCTECNFLKVNRNNEEFLEHIRRIYEHNFMRD